MYTAMFILFLIFPINSLFLYNVHLNKLKPKYIPTSLQKPHNKYLMSILSFD